MSFYLYQSNKLEKLIKEILCPLLGQPLSDPFKAETIIVQNQGMATYLKQQIAQQNRIAFNLEFPFLNNFINDVLIQTVPRQADYSLFLPETMTWKIYALLPGLSRDHSELQNYLKGEGHAVKRYQLAHKIAITFDLYQIYRPDIITGWEQNKSTNTRGWQARLWQQLTRDKASRTAILSEFMAQHSWDNVTDYQRIFIFGIFAMPPVYLQFFRHLSRAVDIHYCYLTPTRHNWKLDLVLKAYQTKHSNTYYLPAELHSDEIQSNANPLVTSFSKMGRYFYSYLRSLESDLKTDNCYESYQGENILITLQNDIYHNRQSTSRKLPSPSDLSVQLHCCHNKLREVEILYDHLLQGFETGDMTPRDIIVMTPDITAYRPYIKAVFDRRRTDEPEYIPYTISDNSQAYSSRIIGTFLQILQLPQSKFEASEILNILEVTVVHTAFEIDEKDLEILRKWITETRINWGIDAQQRADRFGVVPFKENSWQFGMDRMRLGFAMLDDPTAAERLYKGILPYDPIEGDTGVLLGKFLCFIRLLIDTCHKLQGEHNMTWWTIKLNTIIDQFFISRNDTFDGMYTLRQALAKLSEDAESADFQELIPLEVIRDHLSENLNQPNIETGFFRGKVTFCTMQPMRNIPVKRVCLLGMDENKFPRREIEAGFDLISTDPRPCDRSRRDEDRYLFLEALLAAREQFYVSYIGRDLRSNDELPPATTVGEFLDYLKLVYGAEIEENIVRKHHLHGFHPAYFSTQTERKYFSYSTLDASASRSFLGEKRPKEFMITPLEADTEQMPRTVRMIELIRFFKNPPRYFTRQILNINLSSGDNYNVRDAEYFELPNLEAYQMNNGILHSIIKNEPPERYYQLLKAQAKLPIGEHGRAYYYRHYNEVKQLLQHSFRGLDQKPINLLTDSKPKEVEVELDNILIKGQLEFISQNTQLYIRISRLNGKDALAAWIKHLIFSLDKQGEVDTYCLVGKQGRDTLFHFPAIEAERALQYLEQLVSLYQQGLQQVLPFFPKTSFKYVRPFKTLPSDPDKAEQKRITAAQHEWEGNVSRGYPGEGQDEYIRLYFEQGLFKLSGIYTQFRELSHKIMQPFRISPEGTHSAAYQVEELS